MSNHIPPATPPQEKSFELDAEVCDAIAELISFGEHKNFYDCSFQTHGGNKIRVQYIHGSDDRHPSSVHIQVWAIEEQSPDPDALILDTIVMDYDLDTLRSLKQQLDFVTGKRRELETQDSVLYDQEIDLERHVTACTMALLCGVED